MSMRYFCCDERRRGEIAGRQTLNGIDFIEVMDNDSMALPDRQRTLFVHFINDPDDDLQDLEPQNVVIEGGERSDFRDPPVTRVWVRVDRDSGSARMVLRVELARAGDHSLYTLRLVPTAGAPQRLRNVDPVLRAIAFSFKVNCETGFDCAEARACPPARADEPVIDYLARDYASFRRLLLDRLALLVPRWQERNAADGAMALVELLAYVGDYLSYRQDAIATEAYLGTARRRVSVRRHARLVDYDMHDGCNARTWAHVEVTGTVALARGSQFLTAVPGLPNGAIAPAERERALSTGAQVFESMHRAILHSSLNRMEFYTWGARECCLPKGATRATLRGRLAALAPGMVLIFQEMRSSRGGDPGDADPSHRHAVRLVEVAHRDEATGASLSDPIGGRFEPTPSEVAIEVTEIAWAVDDALPFALCISTETEPESGAGYVDRVSIALGNNVLVDHGRRMPRQSLGRVPQPSLERLHHPASDRDVPSGRCRPRTTETLRPRFRPVITAGPLTQAISYEHQQPPASARATVGELDVATAVPQVWLDNGIPWEARRELLNSGEQQHFVVEIESDGHAAIRFGDGVHGAMPPPGSEFVAEFRIGNGVIGNIGADTLVHVVSADSGIRGVTNPLPARGGKEMESIEHARAHAPYAFRTQRRAVTPADYADKAGEFPGVQRAAARLRWTGSWYTMYVSVDRRGGAALDDAFEAGLRGHLEQFRLAGHDLEIDRPQAVPLEVAMDVVIHPDYERSSVRAALLRAFSNRSLPDGTRGVFHPDNFSFGQAVHLSPFYAAAQNTNGVQSVDITIFQRQNNPASDGRDLGKLPMGRFEIPRLDNDPNFPGRGSFSLSLRGGR